MFWSDKSQILVQIQSWISNKELTLDSITTKPTIQRSIGLPCSIQPASQEDVPSIVKLLNEWFEPRHSRTRMAITAEWLRNTFTQDYAIWIVAKDAGGTIRGCVASFTCPSPYPNTLTTCTSQISSRPFGLVDWFCVHPLWRGKKIASGLLNMLDYITYQVGRKGHVFIKEGLPLLGNQIPIYGTVWRWRLAGNKGRTQIREGCGLYVYPFQADDEKTGLPLVRIEGLRKTQKLKASVITQWEDALDKDLPPCIVFATAADSVDEKRGWVYDSPVFLYAFRFTVGKWLGSVPSSQIL
uniref:N-acetyltransferase domain-containing protein n=1 Tax=viral metagenome TaxID=1070528 RepID=A0A6C0KCT7_9ZZZZ